MDDPLYAKAATQRCSYENVLLKSHFDMVFSCEFAAYFQNTFSEKHFWVAAFEP